MDYKTLVNELYQVNTNRGMKYGLQNPMKLNELLGNPAAKVPAIHVAGTNGKGSVSYKIAAALQAEGKKVGLFTSPHISSYRERIQINGKLIEEEAVVRLLSKIKKKAQKENIPATFFELTTALAFLYFAEQKIDLAVIETGLGGRLDATNICHPILTVITSISFDHMHILGKTLDAIAQEKKGIMKPHIPCVLGPNTHTLQGIKVTGKFTTPEKENQAIARLALEELEVREASIEEGVAKSPPCRFEPFKFNGGKIYLDVAHNQDGLKKLFQRREIHKKKPNLIFGCCKDKDIKACLNEIYTQANHFYLVKAKNQRAADPHDLEHILIELGVSKEKISVEKTIEEALQKSTLSPLTVACGTFFIMSELRKNLGVIEPVDPMDINENLPLNP